MDTCVDTPLGRVRVRLVREGLVLSERGGFEAAWVQGGEPETEVLSLEAFRSLVKSRLRALYVEEHGFAPNTVTLNLASHQLVDDVLGWTKLNYPSKGPGF